MYTFTFATKSNKTIILCRAGVVAALYVALTVSLGQLAFGPFQIRPAEALCLLPLFFPETIVGLFVGCALSNLFSGYGVYDIVFGSLVTLIAGGLTYLSGRLIRGKIIKTAVGGLPPVILNAFVIPLVIIFASPGESMASYWIYFSSFILTESVWIYALGIPISAAIFRAREKSVRVFM